MNSNDTNNSDGKIITPSAEEIERMKKMAHSATLSLAIVLGQMWVEHKRIDADDKPVEFAISLRSGEPGPDPMAGLEASGPGASQPPKPERIAMFRAEAMWLQKVRSGISGGAMKFGTGKSAHAGGLGQCAVCGEDFLNKESNLVDAGHAYNWNAETVFCHPRCWENHTKGELVEKVFHAHGPVFGAEQLNQGVNITMMFRALGEGVQARQKQIEEEAGLAP